MQRLAILGATGTIGQQTLAVVAEKREQFSVEVLTAHQNIQRLFLQCQQFQPRYAVVVKEEAAKNLREQLKEAGLKTEVLSGKEALCDVVALPSVDTVVAAIVGSAGLLSTLAAANAGKRLLLANKEALVMSGDLLLQAAKKNHAMLLPIDSEHSAILQCLPETTKMGENEQTVRRVILTASGGALRDLPLEELAQVTPERASDHPTWNMGLKITIDCATMMNKVLEVIEAKILFDLSADQVDAVIHPQSIVHACVEFNDGSMLAQLAAQDMRTPIAYALTWPNRTTLNVPRLDLLQAGRLDFQPVCLKRYPCFKFLKPVLQAGGTTPTVLNAANEIANAAFCRGDIQFTQIASVIEQTLEQLPSESARTLEHILEADERARHTAEKAIAELGAGVISS